MNEKTKKSIIRATIVCFIGIVIIVVICILVGYNEHQKQENYNNITKIIELKAKQCVKDNVCKKTNITLEELYENKYLEEQINPLTNKKFNKYSYVSYPKYKFVLFE